MTFLLDPDGRIILWAFTELSRLTLKWNKMPSPPVDRLRAVLEILEQLKKEKRIDHELSKFFTLLMASSEGTNGSADILVANLKTEGNLAIAARLCLGQL